MSHAKNICRDFILFLKNKFLFHPVVFYGKKQIRTTRIRYWKAESKAATKGKYSPSNLARMKKVLAPKLELKN